MNIPSTALSILPPPATAPSAAPAEPTASPNATTEPSQFAKLLQQRQSADKPAERPAEQASKAPSTPSAQAPQGESKGAEPPQTGPAPATSRAVGKKANLLAELAQTQAPGTDPTQDAGTSQATNTKDEPALETSTANLAQGLLAPVVTTLPAPPPQGLAKQGTEDATAQSLAVPTASPLTVPTAAAPASKQPGARLPAAVPDVEPKTVVQDTALAIEPGTSMMDAPKRDIQPAPERLKQASESSLTPLPQSALPPATGDALKSLARLIDQDKPQRLSSVSEAGPLTAPGAALAPPLQTLSDMTTTRSIHTPVLAPEFKETLATQVSMLAKDGIQQASLQLNPAHMGPISVQISLDGTQTRVDFAADSAVTRQIIEAGLPELASALREAGLTLSGGGVSQQSSQSAQQDAAARQASPSARSRTGSDELALPAPLPTTVSVSQGGLDLYA